MRSRKTQNCTSEDTTLDEINVQVCLNRRYDPGTAGGSRGMLREILSPARVLSRTSDTKLKSLKERVSWFATGATTLEGSWR